MKSINYNHLAGYLLRELNFNTLDKLLIDIFFVTASVNYCYYKNV